MPRAGARRGEGVGKEGEFAKGEPQFGDMVSGQSGLRGGGSMKEEGITITKEWRFCKMSEELAERSWSVESQFGTRHKAWPE